jgi:hypothetical protein
MVAAGMAAMVPLAGDVEAASRSSGGYSRPSAGGYSRPSVPSVRRPSIGGGYTAPRTPSTSGGYSRPSLDGYASPRRPSAVPPSSSPGDQAISRQNSGSALDRYLGEQRRQQQQAARPPAPAQPPPAVPSSPWSASRQRTPSVGGYGGGGGWFGGSGGGNRSGWYANRGWSAPPYAYRSAPSFGIWDGLFLWFMLDTLTRPGHADFFHNHQNDPGYREWRTEADRLAQDNAELRAKLDQLDRQVETRQGQPRDPDYLPPDAGRDVALAPEAQAAQGNTESGQAGLGGGILFVVVIGGGALFLFWMWRRRTAAGRRPGSPGGGGSSGAMKTPLQSAADIVRHKLSGEGYTPTRFRVGMTLAMDPTPFILAAGATKVPTPDIAGDGGNMLINVQAVGALRDASAADARGGSAVLHRLYLPDGRSFFQLHLDAAGNPDECRFFAPIDEVVPASAEEWAFWLDPREGMIGWPEFQTKDGRTYPRAWSPGPGRIEPKRLVETRTEVAGSREIEYAAMLYAAPTGAAQPALQTEYILVSAVRADDGRAWVEIDAGIDVNPAALSLT